MRKSILLLLLAIVAVSLSQARGLRVPPFLKPGDKVAIISPAGPAPQSIIDNGVKALTRWGYEPVVGPSADKRWHKYGGTIKQRRADLTWALQDTSIKAILCTRGGYGCAQVLNGMSVDLFRRNPKWIIGYSDVTALHSTSVSAGNMSIHSVMCDPIDRTDTVTRALQYLLAGKMPVYQVPNHRYNVKGTARGILLGGNLSVLTDLAESPYDMLRREVIHNQDVILFIEDTQESIHHVDRMLHQFMLRGIIGHIKGLIVGIFNHYGPDYGYTNMYDMMNEYFKDLPIPVCYNFPVGHDNSRNFPLVEGCPATLTVGDDSTTLVMSLPWRQGLDL